MARGLAFRGVAFGAVVASLLGGPTSVAEARLGEEYTFAYDQLWRTAVRLIAVDYRFRIRDRDPDIGYLLFDYEDRGRTYGGSVELVRVSGDDGAEAVRVVVQVRSMPSYVERMLLDRLERKLGEDYGPPPVRRPPPAPDQEEERAEDGEDEANGESAD
ncbi:MAG: hypothetical protein ACFCGT_14215 [Sandaracinaceae bacterium]